MLLEVMSVSAKKVKVFELPVQRERMRLNGAAGSMYVVWRGGVKLP